MGGFQTNASNTFGWAELNARGVEKAIAVLREGLRLDPPRERHGRRRPAYNEFQRDGESIAGAMEMDPMVPAQVPSYWTDLLHRRGRRRTRTRAASAPAAQGWWRRRSSRAAGSRSSATRRARTSVCSRWRPADVARSTVTEARSFATAGLPRGARSSEQGWRDSSPRRASTTGSCCTAVRPRSSASASLGEAARLAEAVAAVPGLAGSGVLLTVADDRLTVRLTRDLWRLEERHIELARAVSAVARAHGAVADRAAVQEVQLAIAAKPDAIDVGFWRAVLGYAPMADDNGVDPLGHGSTVWMQELDAGKPLRHAMHVDVSVAREHVEARLAAALAAGGRDRRGLRARPAPGSSPTAPATACASPPGRTGPSVAGRRGRPWLGGRSVGRARRCHARRVTRCHIAGSRNPETKATSARRQTSQRSLAPSTAPPARNIRGTCQSNQPAAGVHAEVQATHARPAFSARGRAA